MSTSVTVNGSAVTITVSNDTTGQSTTKNVTMPNQPDVSTAEWIAEAPSQCDSTSGCQPLTLADFGKVGFTNSSATASGHTGTISDSAWTAQPVTLSPGGGVTDVAASGSSSGGAQPTDLSSDGSSFSVSYVGASSATTSTGGYDPSASGYGYGGGSGGYGYDPGSGGYGYDPAAPVATAMTPAPVATATDPARSESTPPPQPHSCLSSDPHDEHRSRRRSPVGFNRRRRRER